MRLGLNESGPWRDRGRFMISEAWSWIIADTERFKAVAGGVATVAADNIADVVGTVLTKRYTIRRDQQDRESQWRSHAIELARLDLQRKLATRKPEEMAKLRPSILDFLANYRDLQELGQKSPKDLY